MSLQTESRGNAFIVRPQGVLSIEMANEMDGLLSEAMDDGLQRVIFDCSELTRISSDGLRVILKSLRRLHGLGGNAALTSVGEQVRSVLSVGGFFSLIEEFDSVDAAMGQSHSVDDEA